MLRELKLGVFLEGKELAQMATEDGLALDVEHAETIKLSTAPTALQEAATAHRESDDYE